MPEKISLALLAAGNRQSAPGGHNGPKRDEGWRRQKLVGAVEEQGAQRKSIVQQITQKDTDLFGRQSNGREGHIVVGIRRQGTATSTTRRSSVTGGLLHVATSTTVGIRTGSWSYRVVANQYD